MIQLSQKRSGSCGSLELIQVIQVSHGCSGSGEVIHARIPYRGSADHWISSGTDQFGGSLREGRLTRDEEAAERGLRQRACLCASWELRAVGRCVCPETRGENQEASEGQLSARNRHRTPEGDRPEFGGSL